MLAVSLGQVYTFMIAIKKCPLMPLIAPLHLHLRFGFYILPTIVRLRVVLTIFGTI